MVLSEYSIIFQPLDIPRIIYHYSFRLYLIRREGKFEVLSENKEVVLHFLTVIMNPTMNLMSELYYKCERKEHNSSYFENT